MSELKKLVLVFGTMISIIALPYIGAYVYYGGNFPIDHFVFPPLTAPAKAPFNLLVFIAGSLIFLFLLSLYVFPKLYGFKKSIQAEPVHQKTKLPIWFWIGFIMWIVPLTVLVGKFQEPKIIINWADIPMFWGFAILLDGIIYARTGGKSIIGRFPRLLVGVGVASISGWLLFEWLNFFIDDNWCYPMGNLIPESEFTLYAFLGSSGLMPMAFEMFSFLESFPKLRFKYSNGPKIAISRWVRILILVICLVSLWFVNYLPNELFFILWLTPLIMLSLTLDYINVWNPFSAIKKGNWGPVLLFALAFYLQGMMHELWNYMSGVHVDGKLTSANPDYWTYSIPFVDVLHWGEMPFLGLMGYLPFGVYCAIWFISFAAIVNISTPNFEAQQSVTGE